MIQLGDYEFQYRDDGVLLNEDFSGRLPFVDISAVEGLDAAPVRIATRQHEGTVGAFIDADLETERTVVVKGTVFMVSDLGQFYLDKLKANYAPSNDPLPFYFKYPGMEERVVFAKSQGLRYSIDQLRRVGQTKMQVELVCGDPRIYSARLFTVFSYGERDPSEIPGHGFPESFPAGFGGPGSTFIRGAEAFNAGNRPVPAVIRFPGPQRNPKVLHDQTGRFLAYEIGIGSNQELRVNLATRQVHLSGQNRRSKQAAGSRWFLLQPGVNRLRYTKDSDQGKMIVDYRFGWR